MSDRLVPNEENVVEKFRKEERKITNKEDCCEDCYGDCDTSEVLVVACRGTFSESESADDETDEDDDGEKDEIDKIVHHEYRPSPRRGIYSVSCSAGRDGGEVEELGNTQSKEEGLNSKHVNGVDEAREEHQSLLEPVKGSKEGDCPGDTDDQHHELRETEGEVERKIPQPTNSVTHEEL